MIKKHYSLIHADKILNKLFDILGKSESDDERVTVLAWSNCREQGYCLKSYRRLHSDRCVCFAQQRSSEMIVVISGSLADFDVTTNMPNDKLWEHNCKYFTNDDEAVAYIIEELGVIEDAIVSSDINSNG